MNREQTPIQPATVQIQHYSDDVFNLVLSNGNDGINIEIDAETADELCTFFGVELPHAEPEPPKKWG